MDRRQPVTESEQTKQKKTLFERAPKKAALATMLALGIGALAGCSTDAKAESPAPSVTHSAEASPTPSETETPDPVETEPTVVEIEPMSAELPPEELAQATMDLINGWMLSGATEGESLQSAEENTKLAFEGVGGWAYLDIRAERNADKYTPVLLGPNWEEHQDMVHYRGVLMDRNKVYLRDAIEKEDQLVINGTDRSEREPLPTIESEVWDAEEQDPEEENSRTITFSYETVVDNIESATTESLFVAMKYDIVDGKAYLSGHNFSPLPEQDS